MKDLTKEEKKHLLNTIGDGVLALSGGDTPYCIPFGFVYVEGCCLSFTVSQGEKMGNLSRRIIRCALPYLAGTMTIQNGIR